MAANNPEPITHTAFEALLTTMPDIDGEQALGLALSGGPDSMALGFLLAHWASERGKKVYALTVDHGLRENSADEAKQVKEWTAGWPNTEHHILSWSDDKPDTRIMEEARKARYFLMQNFLQTVSVRYMFLAHHLDDQAETFLIRLAKGSGLDGLSGMRAKQPYAQNGAYPLMFLRPFLSIEKQDLIRTCEDFSVPYVSDPSNENESYLRPRLREARAVLESEGLTNKRLATTAHRLEKARAALDEISDQVEQDCVSRSDDILTIDMGILNDWPEEIGFRVFLKVMKSFQSGEGYGPRLEKLEALYGKIVCSRDIMKETLGGCIITYDPATMALKLQGEHKPRR